MRLPRWLFPLCLGIAMLLLGRGTAQAQFGNCTIITTPVSFGVYDVFATTPLDSTGNIHLICFGWLRAVSVWLSGGNSSNPSQRYMVSSDPNVQSHLEYNLYLNASHTQVWGDPTPYSYNTQVRFFFLNLSLDIYGRMRELQDVSAGLYTDSITASVNF